MDFIVIGGGCYGSYHSGQLYKAIRKGKLPADARIIIVDRHATPPAFVAHGDKPEFVFVQSDWQTYLRACFDPSEGTAAAYTDVQIVPAPFAPHLLFDWLREAVQTRLAAQAIVARKTGFAATLGLPYEYTDPKEGNHFISRAGWRCPSACIEPATCPAVRGRRDWDLGDDVTRYVNAGMAVAPSHSAAAALAGAWLPNGLTVVASTAATDTITFTCHHYVHGIGTTPATQLYAARERVVNAALAHFATPAAPPLHFAVGTLSHCHGVVATLSLTSAA